jgi:hypothetical protein
MTHPAWPRLLSPLSLALLLPALPALVGSGPSGGEVPRGFSPQAIVGRAETRQVGGVSVSVASLNDAEAHQLVGFDLAKANIQPVWIRVRNAEDTRYYIPPITIDSEYFSPLEVAWQGHRLLDPAGNARIDARLRRLELPEAVDPGQTISGYVFTNRDEGIKYADVELVAPGRRRVRRLSFLTRVPGLRTDFQKVNWEHLQAPGRMTVLTEAQLKTWLEALPCCAMGGDRRTPADPLNIVLIGDAEAVFPALARRGWHVTQTLSADSLWQTITSSLFGHRYRYAPVSPLYLFGRPQDLALQKGRSDVNQRNHMRLWLAPVTVTGTPVWVGQISRDIGVRLTRKTITTHKIDPSVDETRWYLMQDLYFSEGLERFGFVTGVGAAPPEQPRFNYTGDPYETDGLRAVLWLTATPVSVHRVATQWPPPQQIVPRLAQPGP